VGNEVAQNQATHERPGEAEHPDGLGPAEPPEEPGDHGEAVDGRDDRADRVRHRDAEDRGEVERHDDDRWQSRDRLDEGWVLRLDRVAQSDEEGVVDSRERPEERERQEDPQRQQLGVSRGDPGRADRDRGDREEDNTGRADHHHPDQEVGRGVVRRRLSSGEEVGVGGPEPEVADPVDGRTDQQEQLSGAEEDKASRRDVSDLTVEEDARDEADQLRREARPEDRPGAEREGVRGLRDGGSGGRGRRGRGRAFHGQPAGNDGPRFLCPSLESPGQLPGREVGGSSPERRSYNSTQSPSGSDRKTRRISPSSNGGISTRAPSAINRSTTASRSVTRNPRWSSSSPRRYGGSPG